MRIDCYSCSTCGAQWESEAFEMVIPVPTDRDDEEYIDELLDGILNNEVRYNIEWDFVDGLS